MDLIKFGVKVNKETNKVEASVESSPVGQVTGSSKKDFYVYEWFIVSTGEIFYVGKGRGDRYKEYHERAYEAEKIRKLYNTDVRFVAKNLSEEEAVEMESIEMLRILNETTDRLTNRMTPLVAKRQNGYGPSPNTPALQREKAPVLWACEIDEHYFNVEPREFDKVEFENLKKIHFVEKKVFPHKISSIYGKSYKPYYEEVCSWLHNKGCTIVKSKFAKSVSAWVYIGDDDVHNYHNNQRLALERLGRNVPVYHLIDLWHFVKRNRG